MTIRILVPGDEDRLDAFLARHADSSMFLRGNVRAAGLVDRGEPLQGTYVGAFEGEDVIGVAAHAWNGFVLVQAPTDALVEVVRAAVSHSGRAVTGISGPHRQVVAARHALSLDTADTSMEAREVLMALHLDDLVIPPPLARGDVRCIRPRDEHRALAAAWRAEYCVETLGDRDTPALREACRRDIDRLVERESCFLLLDRTGEPVSFTAFNSELPDCVQVGGVFTPKPLRGRGFARSAVASSLLVAAERGVPRSVLFTPEDNVSARSAYAALGYEVVGDYGLIRFRV